MLSIYNGRQHFWQWDTNQKLVVVNGGGCEVHFRNPDGGEAFILKTYELNGTTVVDVPNILLQKSGQIHAWLYVCIGEDDCTINERSFDVWPRQKPADYVYTETEVQNYKDFEARLSALEKAGVTLPQIGEADNGKVMTAVDGEWQAQEVETSDQVAETDQRPITSQAVYTEFSTIVALLQTI